MTAVIVKTVGILGLLVLVGWLYWLTGKVQLLLTYGEQVIGMGAQVIAAAPSKSADRTTAPDDAPAFVPYAGLREMDADRWADDGGPEPITEPIPVVPATEPIARVDVVGGARITGRPVPHKRGRHRKQAAA